MGRHSSPIEKRGVNAKKRPDHQRGDRGTFRYDRATVDVRSRNATQYESRGVGCRND